MMWEGEFLEFAKTAKAGFLSRQEAEGLWKEYETAENVSRDMKGPRGYLRCAIKVKDVLNQFEEVKRSQTAKREAKFGKNTTDDVFAKKINMVFSGKQAGTLDDNFDNVMEKADESIGEGGMFDGSLTAPDIAELQRLAKSKKKKAGEETEEEGEDKEPEDPNKNKNENTEEKEDWLDETKIRKAERLFASTIKKKKEDLQDQARVMLTHMQEFSAKDSLVTAFRSEIMTMDYRRKWLQAIFAEQEDVLPALIEQHEKQEQEDKDTARSEQASSRDMSSIQRAGPCLGWRKLVHFSKVIAHQPGARECETAETLKTWGTGCSDIFLQWAVLMTSCKSAASDLLSARSSAENEAKKAEDKKVEDAKKAKEQGVRVRKAKPVDGISLLDLDFVNSIGTPIDTSSGTWPKDLQASALRTPVLVSGCAWIQERVKATQATFICV